MKYPYRHMIFVLPILLILPHVIPSEQTDITFDDPTIDSSSPYYVKQICTEVRAHTCCEPLSLQIEGVPGWFHSKRVIYTHLPTSSSPIKNYLAVFTYDKGNAACRGRAVELAYLYTQRTWRSTYLQYPYFTGGALLTKEQPVALLYDVYPDTVTYQGVNYTDNNRGNGVYESSIDPNRVIYGWTMFRMLD